MLPTLGVTHALWLAFASLLERGDEVLVESPCYEPMWRIPEGLGAQIRFYDRACPEPGAVIAAIRKQHTPQTRLVVLSHLHNPTGARISDSELSSIAEHCLENASTLLVDEVYAPYTSPLSQNGSWPSSACHYGDNVVAVSGLSKAFGLGAIRAGWLLASSPTIRRAEHIIQSTLGEMLAAQRKLAARAFAHLDALSEEREEQLREGGLGLVDQWVRAHPALAWNRPEKAPFGLVYVQGAGCLRERLEQCAVDSGVLVAPGTFFRAPNAFRIGWSVPSELLRSGLAALTNALEL